MTLDSLKALHDAGDVPTTLSAYRLRARKLAAELGVEVPDWAAKRKLHRAPPRPTPEPSLETPPAGPIEITPALSAWRSGGAGRVVNVKRDGSVRLVVLGFGGTNQEAAFTDVRTAERALLLGITWRPQRKAG